MKIRLLDRLNDPTREDYDKSKASYIAEYTEYEPGYKTGGYFGVYIPGKYVHKPESGKAEWDKMYPSGYISWCSNNGVRLSAHGDRELVRKVNEIIKYLNKEIK